MKNSELGNNQELLEFGQKWELAANQIQELLEIVARRDEQLSRSGLGGFEGPGEIVTMDKLKLAIANIVEETSKRLRQVAPPDDLLWDTEEVASYLHRSKQTVVQVTSLPSFPKGIRIPYADGTRSRPLYLATEVIAWTRKQKDRN